MWSLTPTSAFLTVGPELPSTQLVPNRRAEWTRVDGHHAMPVSKSVQWDARSVLRRVHH